MSYDFTQVPRITRLNVQRIKRRAWFVGFFVGCVFATVLAVALITYLQQKGVNL